MPKFQRILFLLTCVPLWLAVAPAHAATLENLRCEAKVNPAGIDVTTPRLSWVIKDDNRGAGQTAYQVLVASTAEALANDQGDLWDSGKTASKETFNIEYAGKPLAAEQRCFWKAKTWNEKGEASEWSAPASWFMGLLKPDQWQAQWIGFDAPRAAAEANLPPAPKPDPSLKGKAAKNAEAKLKPLLLPPPVYLRTSFIADKEIKRATLHAASLGLADVYLNGKLVTANRFASGWTDYTKRVYSRSYDVTADVRNGENGLGAILGDGWFSGYIGFGHNRDHYGKNPRVLAQLHIEYADGSSAIVATGPQWKASTGALQEGDFLMGESYDARLEPSKWSEAGFDASKWTGVNVGASVSPVVQSHPGPLVAAIKEFKAKNVTEPAKGVYLLDLGQNFAGISRLTLKGEPGQKITLRFGEMLQADGSLYTENLRSARATDTYICRGGGVETWEQRFTFHGFRYVEITGLKEKPEPDTLVGLALSSDTQVVGDFACSDPMLTQLHSNVYWTQRMNFIDIPTDCPQRDERLGWTGDAQIYIRTATLNTDVQAFFTKWLVDLKDAQREDGQFPTVAPLKVAGPDGGSAWADAGIVCPWTIYSVYGDSRLLAAQYPSMARYIDFCQKRSTKDGLPPAKFHTFGDWLSIDADTPKDVLYTAYYAQSVDLMSRAAEALGKKEDAAKYHALFEQIKAGFNKAFVSKDAHIKGETQCDYVMAIAFNLLDEEKTKLAAELLVKNIESKGWHLSTGFIGTKDLMLALSKIGRNDVAYRLVHNDTFPSWGFSIKNGATTIWERWNGWTPEKGFGPVSMNSYAHYSFGAVYQWMVENIGGIRNDGLAYGKIAIAPQLDAKLTHAETGYNSIRGLIETKWKKEDQGLSLGVTIPPNTSATVAVPAGAGAKITEGGKPVETAPGVKFLRKDPKAMVYEVEAGNYQFRSTVLP